MDEQTEAAIYGAAQAVTGVAEEAADVLARFEVRTLNDALHEIADAAREIREAAKTIAGVFSEAGKIGGPLGPR